MAYIDGPMGTAKGTIDQYVPPAAGDGPMGMIVGRIDGYRSGVSDGPMGMVKGTIERPHTPVGVLVNGRLEFVRILTLHNGQLV